MRHWALFVVVVIDVVDVVVVVVALACVLLALQSTLSSNMSTAASSFAISPNVCSVLIVIAARSQRDVHVNCQRYTSYVESE